MIKCEYENRDGIVRLKFITNNEEADRDILDAIGSAILTNAPKRGSYLTGDTMAIDIRKPE